ncbi:MAG: hypothetical protein MH252_03600 [Thermosynechococcaceae cyanobacterium MS004]|nr:hypothetical protein [Thermosynechococcaceae cyanobacterium MS004]
MSIRLLLERDRLSQSRQPIQVRRPFSNRHPLLLRQVPHLRHHLLQMNEIRLPQLSKSYLALPDLDHPGAAAASPSPQHTPSAIHPALGADS